MASLDPTMHPGICMFVNCPSLQPDMAPEEMKQGQCGTSFIWNLAAWTNVFVHHSDDRHGCHPWKLTHSRCVYTHIDLCVKLAFNHNYDFLFIYTQLRLKSGLDLNDHPSHWCNLWSGDQQSMNFSGKYV